MFVGTVILKMFFFCRVLLKTLTLCGGKKGLKKMKGVGRGRGKKIQFVTEFWTAVTGRMPASYRVNEGWGDTLGSLCI